jgi:hypothetical protein
MLRPVVGGTDTNNADNIEVPAKDNNITGDISTLVPTYGIKSVISDEFQLTNKIFKTKMEQKIQISIASLIL